MRPAIDLASRSPRRKTLLEVAGFDVFSVPGRPEPPMNEGEPSRVAQALAQAKLPDAAAPDRVLLAADTVVALGHTLFGKPRDRADARRMLAVLSGRAHQVVTGVALRYRSEQRTFAVSSTVIFRELHGALVEAYLETGEPDDKAGAYGIQGQGVALVERVEGSYTNVVGLPMTELLAQLRDWGVSP